MVKKGKFLLSISIFLVLTISLFSFSVYASDDSGSDVSSTLLMNQKILGEKSFSSPIWAGYTVSKIDTNGLPQEKSVNFVTGSWIVPSVDCSSTPNGYVAIWVGIDGYGSSTIEQIGTNSQCDNGKQLIYAWWETYPDPSKKINYFPVKPGDNIKAQVEFIGNKKFNLTITNLNTGKTFSKIKKVPDAQRTSGEWIIEAPQVQSQIQPLANFNSVTFTNAQAKIKGTMGKINNPSWRNYEIDMVGDSVLKADTSPLTSSGDSFNVTWMHS